MVFYTEAVKYVLKSLAAVYMQYQKYMKFLTQHSAENVMKQH